MEKFISWKLIGNQAEGLKNIFIYILLLCILVYITLNTLFGYNNVIDVTLRLSFIQIA